MRFVYVHGRIILAAILLCLGILSGGAVQAADEDDGCYCNVINLDDVGPPNINDIEFINRINKINCVNHEENRVRYSLCEWRSPGCARFTDDASCGESENGEGVFCVWEGEPDDASEGQCVEATSEQLGDDARQIEAEEHVRYELPKGIKERLNPLDIESVPMLIGRLIKIFMQIVGSIALLMFIYGGVLWMIDAGNSEKQKTAMKIIVWSSLGIVVILASYILVDFAFEAFR